jgi:putative ABC transport system ATP-binding protein
VPMPDTTATADTRNTSHRVGAACARLVKIYPSATGETHALRGVEAQFRAGRVTAVTGPSGSGKSSLLSLLALRERPSGGEVWLLGERADGLGTRRRRELVRRQVGWVPQRPSHDLFPQLTAAEQLEQAVRLRAADGTRELDDGLLDRLGLGQRASARPMQMSGGEQQRLAVAAAVVGRPGVVLVDEPTAELDDESAALVLAELLRCAADDSTVVVTTHDQRVVAAADTVLALRHGVLSTERGSDGTLSSPIDSSGRVQLPPAALAMFPDARAVVVVEDGSVRLMPPEPEP